jgi:hypothetical protein
MKPFSRIEIFAASARWRTAHEVEAKQHHVMFGQLAKHLDRRLIDTERLGKAPHQTPLRLGRWPLSQTHHRHALGELAGRLRIIKRLRQLFRRNCRQGVKIVVRAQDVLLRGIQKVTRGGTERAMCLPQHPHGAQTSQSLFRIGVKKLHDRSLCRREVPVRCFAGSSGHYSLCTRAFSRTVNADPGRCIHELLDGILDSAPNIQ